MSNPDTAPTPSWPGTHVELSLRRLDESSATVHVRGALTVLTSHQLRRHLGPIVHSGAQQLVVDLSGVQDIDPAGLAVLLVYARSMRCLGRTLVLVDVPPAFARLLALVGADLLTVAPASPSPRSRGSNQPQTGELSWT